MNEQKQSLDDFLPDMKAKDVIAATRVARQKAGKLFNDQGISAMALLLSDVISDTLEHPERLLERSISCKPQI